MVTKTTNTEKMAAPQGKAVTDDAMQAITTKINLAMQQFASYADTMRPIERSRKISAGIKNFGFIENAFQSAEANPLFVPAYLSMSTFSEEITDIELKRALLLLLKQFEQEVSDSLLDSGDAAYHDALLYYNSLKEADKQKIPGAEALFKALQPFFKKTITNDGEPTEIQVERDVRALLHGTKDGEVIIKHQHAESTGGVHEVVDDTHSAHSSDVIDEEIEK
jgi:hypothetical protein